MKHAKNMRISSLLLQKKYNNILGEKSLFFFNSWNFLERNIGVKYVGERKIKLIMNKSPNLSIYIYVFPLLVKYGHMLIVAWKIDILGMGV